MTIESVLRPAHLLTCVNASGRLHYKQHIPVPMAATVRWLRDLGLVEKRALQAVRRKSIVERPANRAGNFPSKFANLLMTVVQATSRADHRVDRQHDGPWELRTALLRTTSCCREADHVERSGGQSSLPRRGPSSVERWAHANLAVGSGPICASKACPVGCAARATGSRR